eukprot:TRINITY_DN21797_c0_g1_i1.p1 TRINITY_DN21797_c0_g1~~TRINITY_DN21797_c0_g1_i1.p1  ORF type:complete len:106 (-),score=3.40 TRINITY_DN21797_c0_g1_i1:591-908(-)
MCATHAQFAMGVAAPPMRFPSVPLSQSRFDSSHTVPPSSCYIASCAPLLPAAAASASSLLTYSLLKSETLLDLMNDSDGRLGNWIANYVKAAFPSPPPFPMLGSR